MTGTKIEEVYHGVGLQSVTLARRHVHLSQWIRRMDQRFGNRDYGTHMFAFVYDFLFDSTHASFTGQSD